MLEDQLIQNGVIFNNILLIWRDKFFEDAYFGSDFMLIGITDPKLSEITLVSQVIPSEIKVLYSGGGPSRGILCHFEEKDFHRFKNIL